MRFSAAPRYDYEGCESAPCNQMMADLQTFVDDKASIGKKFTGGKDGSQKEFVVSKADNFSYTDPVDGSVTTKQGRRRVSDGQRAYIIFFSVAHWVYYSRNNVPNFYALRSCPKLCRRYLGYNFGDFMSRPYSRQIHK